MHTYRRSTQAIRTARPSGRPTSTCQRHTRRSRTSSPERRSGCVPIETSPQRRIMRRRSPTPGSWKHSGGLLHSRRNSQICLLRRLSKARSSYGSLAPQTSRADPRSASSAAPAAATLLHRAGWRQPYFSRGTREKPHDHHDHHHHPRRTPRPRRRLGLLTSGTDVGCCGPERVLPCTSHEVHRRPTVFARASRELTAPVLESFKARRGGRLEWRASARCTCPCRCVVDQKFKGRT
jgi:hypothetical protein